MPASRDRRSFLRQALPDAAREVGRARRAFEREAGRVGPPVAGVGAAQRPWASHAARCCDRDQLAVLTATYGLADRVEAVLELSSISHRLCPAVDAAPGALARATMSETEARAALDLRSLGADALAAGRPPGFLLLAASFVDGQEATTVTAGYRESRDREPSAVCGQVVAGSVERVLPRAWAAAVEALDLTPDEQTAWNDLRAALARWQGVTPVDATEQTHRLHRLLGLPDERTGTLPEACERLRPSVGGDARRWTLVLQMATPLGGADELVTIWGDRRRVAAGDVRGLVAVRRP